MHGAWAKLPYTAASGTMHDVVCRLAMPSSPAMIVATAPAAGIVAHTYCVNDYALLYTTWYALGKGWSHARLITCELSQPETHRHGAARHKLASVSIKVV